MANTREKLIELFNESLFAESWDSNDYPNDEAAVDYLIANGVTVNEWISVKDRLPKKRGHYFIAYRFMDDGANMQFFGEAMWHDDIPDNGYVKGDHFSNEGVDGMHVTHWMEIPPLPQPPKGE